MSRPWSAAEACTEEQDTVPGLCLESILIFYFTEKLGLQPSVSSKVIGKFMDDFQDPNILVDTTGIKAGENWAVL